MKWEDLEPGDIVRVTQCVKMVFPNAEWANKNLIINEVEKFYECIRICCDNNQHMFIIDIYGRCRDYEYLGPFFEILKLGDK